MKILFITCAEGIDYLSDCIFHGLVTFGYDVIDSKYQWYLSNTITKEQQLKLYGKGFTISGLLPDRQNIDRTNLEQRIKQKEFDYVFYGSIHRCQDYLNLVLQYYDKKHIAFFDGQDQINAYGWDIINELLDKGVYFRRQLKDSRAVPISFAIPKQKILNENITKEIAIATITPYDRRTYIYTNEHDYYMGYAKSNFGITCKKGGWDCLRHYQIIGNNCLPLFNQFEKCPRFTMVNWPTELQLLTNNMFLTKNFNDYNIILNQFFDYCKKYLTTQALAKHIFERL